MYRNFEYITIVVVWGLVGRAANLEGKRKKDLLEKTSKEGITFITPN